MFQDLQGGEPLVAKMAALLGDTGGITNMFKSCFNGSRMICNRRLP